MPTPEAVPRACAYHMGERAQGRVLLMDKHKAYCGLVLMNDLGKCGTFSGVASFSSYALDSVVVEGQSRELWSPVS